MNRHIKLVGFDVDGVLLDSFNDIYKVDSGIIEKYVGKRPTQNEYRQALLGTTDWSAFYNQFSVPEKFMKAALDEFYSDVIKKSSAIAGVHAVLEKIRQPKFIVSLNPNRDALCSNLINECLMRYFKNEDIYSSGKKKAPLIIKAYQRYGVKPTESIYLGDSPSDINEARKAGVITAAISSDSSFASEITLLQEQPDFLIHSLDELVEILK